MEGNPLRIFGLLGTSELAPDTAPLDLGEGLGEVRAPAMPRPGQRVDERFVIQSSLGQGAFGEVLRARDESLGRDVAIKFLYRRSPEVRERFRREAQTTASLDHPNVLSIHEFRLEGPRPYIVYELIEEARTLDEAFRSATLPERLDLFEQALAGVAAAHAAGVIHRDLKPENVLVRPDGQVRVADFGLARTDESKLTATGAFLGTPAYMAPEQVTGGEVSPASDVWSLGLILYEALYEEDWSGRFVTPQELLATICAARIPRPEGGPPALGDLLFQRVLLERPQDRLPDAGAFLSALRAARRAAGATRPRPWLTLGALALGFVLGGLAQAAWGGSSSTAPTAASALGPSPTATPAASPAATPAPTPGAAPPPAFGTREFYAHRRQLRVAPQETLLAAGALGDVAAMQLLGERFALGWRCEKDPVASKEWWERAAKGGSSEALEKLSVIAGRAGRLEEGRELHAQALAAGSSLALMRDFDPLGQLDERAIRTLERLVSLGDTQAAGRLAVFADRHGSLGELRAWASIGVALRSPAALVLQARFELHSAPPDRERLHEHLRSGRELAHPEAFALTALCLTTGFGVPQDLAGAERALQEAERLGARPGDLAYYRCRLAVKRHGPGQGSLDLVPFVELCRREGSPYAKGELGVFLLRFTRNRKEQNRETRQVAGQLLRQARRSVDARVHRHLAMLLKSGELPSPRAQEEAAEAFKRAADRSWVEARGWGVSRLLGQGVAKDIGDGVAWLQRAADAGDSESWRLLGIAYADGVEVPELKDLPRALKCFERGAKLGSGGAAVGAGILLTRKRELSAARKMFLLAANKGLVDGVVNYAICLLEGRGGPVDHPEALRRLLAVPAQKQTRDFCRLMAKCYSEGIGVEPDPAKAEEWTARAATAPTSSD